MIALVVSRYVLDCFRAERNAGMTALIEALRTPEERFVRLPNYTFRPHYLDDLKGYEGLRVHTVDERPAKPATNMQTYLCLHGEPTWAYLLAAGHRVVAPDFLGFGTKIEPLDQPDPTSQSRMRSTRLVSTATCCYG